MVVRRQMFFNDLDSLMEEHFWMFAKFSIYKEKNPSFNFGMTINIHEIGYSIDFYAETSTKDNRSNCSRKSDESAGSGADNQVEL